VFAGPVSITGRSVASASDQVALRQARAKVRSAHPDSVFGFATMTLTLDSLSGMMQQDLALNSRYLAWLKASKGDAAAQAYSANVSGPYQRRIDALRARSVDSEDITIPVVTVWGSITFSTRSYDPSLGPMDPVSMLFVGDASPDRVYSTMV